MIQRPHSILWRTVPSIVAACFVSWSHSEVPELPPLFVTSDGIEIVKGRVTSISGDSVKIFHDNGVANIELSKLPTDVAKLFGIEIESQPPVTLPDPFIVKSTPYSKTTIVAIEPDGIRITHSSGAAKINYEDLTQDLQDELGPFDSEAAREFRQATEERNREAYQFIQATKAEIREAENEQWRENKRRREQALRQLIEDPSLISTPVGVGLSAYSVGGKNRSSTGDSLSSVRTETSSRTMRCTIENKMGAPQRVRLQCLFITREVVGREGLAATVVADGKVNLGPDSVSTIEARANAQKTEVTVSAVDAFSLPNTLLIWRMTFIDGEKYVGWCWRAIDGRGRVSAVRSSIPHYDRFGWSHPVN